MKPFAIVLVFTFFPMLVRTIKAVLGMNDLLERYFAWVEGFKAKKGVWSRAAWCVAFHAPAFLAVKLCAALIWFSASGDSGFFFYWDRAMAGVMSVVSLGILGGAVWLFLKPERIKRAVRPRIRVLSRSQLGY